MHSRLALRLGLALFVLTLLAFAPLATQEFLSYDDSSYVTENRMVQGGLSWTGWHWAWTTFTASNWHPLTWLSHMLDCQVFGLNPRGHHLINLLLHAANTLMLYLVLRRLTGETWRSALVAALFAVHPLHVESVAWVAERKDVLSAFFGLLALAAYAWYVERPGLARYGLVLVAFGASLLAKPMLVTLPCVLLLLDYWPLRRVAGTRPRWLLLEKVPLLALSAASCVVTILAQSTFAAVSVDKLPWPERVANALVAYVVYLRKTVWPADLAILYPHRGILFAAWEVAGAAVVLLAVTALAVAWRRRQPALLVGWLWYLGTLVPVLGLVQVGVQGLADRYTYVPLIGIFLALAWSIPSGLGGRSRGRVLLAASAASVLLACVTVTWLQLRYWRDEGALWQHTLAVTTDNPVAHLCLGTVLYRQGRVEEAEEHFTRATELSPHYDLAWSNLGISRLRQGQVEQALSLFARAIAINARKAPHQNNRGLALLRKGRPADACRSFRAAIQLDPAVAEYHYNLAAALDEQGEATAARQEYQAGLRLDESWPRRMHLLARGLLQAANPKLRCPAEVLFRARQVCAAVGGEQPDMLETLAAAYAASGRAAEATTTMRQALTLAEAQGRSELSQRLRDELRRYESTSAKTVRSGEDSPGP